MPAMIAQDRNSPFPSKILVKSFSFHKPFISCFFLIYTHASGFFLKELILLKVKINMCVHFIKRKSVSWVSMSVTLFCLVLEAELQFTLFQNIFQQFQHAIQKPNLHYSLLS